MADGTTLRIGIDMSIESVTVDSPYAKVSKEVFMEYLDTYPYNLIMDVNGIHVPPLLNFHDIDTNEIMMAIVIDNFQTEGDKWDENNTFYVKGKEQWK